MLSSHIQWQIKSRTHIDHAGLDLKATKSSRAAGYRRKAMGSHQPHGGSTQEVDAQVDTKAQSYLHSGPGEGGRPPDSQGSQ